MNPYPGKTGQQSHVLFPWDSVFANLPVYLGLKNYERTIMGYGLSEILEKFPMPVHLHYAPRFRENIREFKQVFEELYPNGFVRYAAKANTHPAILRIIKEEGAGIDAASYYEARCSLEAGIPPEDIDLNGNCKEDWLIEDSIKKNVLIVADSIEEFRRVADIAHNLNMSPRVILRISGYDLGPVTAATIFTAGNWTKFGTPLRDIPGFIMTLHDYPHIRFMGFHTHIGSQITEVEPYLAVLGKMVEVGRLLNETGNKCEIINIGGGFPVSYLDRQTWEYMLVRLRNGFRASWRGDISKLHSWGNDTGGFEHGSDGKLDLDNWTGEKFFSPYPKAEMLRKILTGVIEVNGRQMHAIDALQLLGEPKLMVEPGRSIAEDTGVTLAKVGFVRKMAWGHNLITLEMGVMNHCDSLLEPGMKLWEVANDVTRRDSEPFEAFVGGNLCFSGDMIARYKVALQRKPQRGDILLIRDTGAYTAGFMAANSNSFPRPDRILIDEDGSITVMKRRDTYNEIFSLD